MSVVKQFHFRMTDKAWAELVAQGRAKGYIRSTTHATGLALYMTELLLANPAPTHWKDTRPDYVRALDLPLLESGRTPMWDTEELRILRCLSVEPEAQELTNALGKALGLVRVSQGVRAWRNAGLFSEFWEAVGLGWLTPTEQPTKKWRTKRRPPPPTEFSW